ncbi:HAD-IA family hydrolase [Pantanalinema rosaneae CENA516]|uniref:HAD-IA family hydrolase n=1 Tax=Pantanalinema rosaneae TaxID=1620701 RepID=UPI003D6E9884
MKVLIFDFDGTIADSFDTVLTIANRLAHEFGYPFTPPETAKHLKHLSSREIVRQSQVAFWQIPFLLKRLRSELHHEIQYLHPIPGMAAALQEIHQQGHHLGIVTSNSQENVAAFLDTHGLSELFDFIGSGLTVFGKGRVIQAALRQYQLDPATVIYVGDETRDIEAAKKIGIPVIAVSWGFNSAQALAKHYPNLLIHHPEELVKAVNTGCINQLL